MLKSKDRDEAEALYLAAFPRLVACVQVVTRSRSDAEEIAQEAFVRLLQRWDRVSRYELPEAWLRLVALRLAYRWATHQRAVSDPDHLPEVSDPSPDVEAAERRLDLDRALATLPATQRAILTGFYLLDLSVDELATVFGLTPGATKTRLHRARAAIRLSEKVEDFT